MHDASHLLVSESPFRKLRSCNVNVSAAEKMETIPVTNEARGAPVSTESTVLTSVASVTQDLAPLNNICAHLNAFHAYASDPGRGVETNHYCGHVNDDVRQCLLYDSDDAKARLIGIEYMVMPRVYEFLPPEERRLWHSHVYEVKSGMLVMPNRHVPGAVWEAAEKREIEHVIRLYGKVYHLWQTDRGHEVPLRAPQLMTSYTADGQLDFSRVEERDARLGTDHRKKREARRDMASPEIHPNADGSWKAQ